jgi:PAS domain S-box-containing protein
MTDRDPPRDGSQNDPLTDPVNDDEEDRQLRTVALQNANSIRLARRHAEQQLLEAQEALREKEERLRAIFDHAAVGIGVSAFDGHFVDMNRKFCEILGYTVEELRARTFTDITHPDDRPATTAAVTRLLAGEIPDYALEKRYLRKDGTFVWSRATVTLLRDAAGRPEQFIGVVEDITSRKDAEEALRQALAERQGLLDSERAARASAERMSDLKDEFLATLSHELRTPLNAILGWSQVLRGGPKDPADLVKALDTIERNARMQTQLIEDLLDMSRITSGKVRLDVQLLQPLPIVEAAVETVRPAADAKHIRLDLVLDPAAAPISGDPGRLQQIVWNLLSNAIKFTPKEGTIRIGLARVRSHVEISVADTGVGIKPEFIAHLFERFRQGDASTTRKFGGLGLGLSIVKSLVELHGGSVSVTSPGEGLGTTVTVRLPLTAVHTPARVQLEAGGIGPPQPVAAELAGLRILVVDDLEDARELIRRVLEDAAAEVVTASSADEALSYLEHDSEGKEPNLLITDIGMPEADGFELLRRVRQLDPQHGGRIPAIALTAFARSEDRTRALRAGFLVHVSKPVDPSELVATVASVAGRFYAGS